MKNPFLTGLYWSLLIKLLIKFHNHRFSGSSSAINTRENTFISFSPLKFLVVRRYNTLKPSPKLVKFISENCTKIRLILFEICACIQEKGIYFIIFKFWTFLVDFLKQFFYIKIVLFITNITKKQLGKSVESFVNDEPTYTRKLIFIYKQEKMDYLGIPMSSDKCWRFGIVFFFDFRVLFTVVLWWTHWMVACSQPLIYTTDIVLIIFLLRDIWWWDHIYICPSCIDHIGSSIECI